MPELPPHDPADQRVEVLTGRAEVDLKAGTMFSDELRLRRGDAVLTAPSARYDQESGQFTMEGGLEFRDPDTRIRGQDATYDTDSNRVAIEAAEFQLFAVPSRGSASSISVEERNELRLRDVSYTTCAPGKDDWQLRAAKISIDRAEGIATARNARLEFQGVPILYTPWISYPVTNERKSGFLLPGLGRSETRGFEFQIPYYLNLAPNYDATFTPHYMSQRGLQLISEARYLGDGDRGLVDLEYLPNDEATDDDRYLFGLQHQSLLWAGWRATLNGKTVSDTHYFEDLYGSLSATSQTHLRHQMDLEYFSNYWAVLGRFLDFETLDESLTGTEKPYRVAPQLAARGYSPRGLFGLSYLLEAEFAYFDRNAGVTGGRLHAAPEIGLPIRHRGFYVEPAVALDYTRYSLNDVTTGAQDEPERTAPIYSVDVGTVLERVARLNTGWLQTLEPRAQFVHIPFRNQDDLPVFDTIEPDFNLVQLFRKNRFLGYDRLGDTNQLNLGVTSRLLDGADGTQFVTATLGQTRFFTQQDVTLPGGVPTDDNSSNYVAELGLNFYRHWNMDLGYQWDSDAGTSQLTEARVQYRRDSARVLNLSYRYRRDTVEEIDVSAAWPLGDRWSAVGRYDYSILDNEPLERFAGLEYHTCCWGVRLVFRRYLATRTGESDTAIALQLILKGLTNVGDPADRLLERGILGYEAE
jgi:LPS-assembly protein